MFEIAAVVDVTDHLVAASSARPPAPAQTIGADDQARGSQARARRASRSYTRWAKARQTASTTTESAHPLASHRRENA